MAEVTPAPQESTSADYWANLNMFGMQTLHPDTRTYTEDMKRTGLTFEDQTMKEAFSTADVQTQYEMLKARNDGDAYKIFLRRKYQAEHQQRIAQDGFFTQMAMGALPAVATPTSLIPGGALFKVAQTANKARLLWMAGAGATTATAANLIDEAALGKQGMETNYLGVAGASIVFGGGLGMLGGLLTGPNGKALSKNLLKEGDVISAERAADEFTVIDNGTNTLLVPKMDKSLFDRVPYLGEWFKSSITEMRQSDSAIIRQMSARLSGATISEKAADGSYIVLGDTAASVKQGVLGAYNSGVTIPITQAFKMYKEAGGVGNRDYFTQEVHRVYVEESNRMRNESMAHAKRKAAGKLEEIDAQYKQEWQQAQLPLLYYKNAKNELVPIDEKWMADQQAKRDAHYQGLAAKEEMDTVTIPAMREDAKATIENYKSILQSQGVKGKELIARVKEFRQITNDQLKADIAELRKSTVVPKYKEVAIIEKKLSSDELAKIKKDLRTRRKADQDAALEVHVEDYYNKNDFNFKSDNAGVVDAAKAFSEYFDNMLKRAQALGVEELMGAKVGRLYSPRNWNFRKIAELPKDEVITRLKNALISDSRNSYSNEKELMEDVETLYRALTDKNVESNLCQGRGYYTKSLPFQKRLNAQKIRVDESKLGDLLHNNMEDVSGMYSYFMSGRMAVQHAFSDLIKDGNVAEIGKRLQEEVAKTGETISAKDLKAFTNTVDDILGVRRMDALGNEAQWQFTRNMMTYNSARLMGGAGGNQVIELATIVMMNLAKGIMTKNFMGAAKEVARMLFKGEGPSSDIAKVLIDSGYMDAALHNHRANRIADNEAGFNPKLLERIGHSLADFQMKFNGQRYFTALAEDLSGGNIIQYIRRADPKDEAMFSRWGLSMNDVKDLKKVFDINDKEFLQNMTKQQRAKFQLAVTNGVAEWVVQPNSIHLPDWFKGAGAWGKLLFQFMKFPMIAQETLLRRGFTEERASMIAGIFGAATMYTAMKYLREEASVSLGLTNEADRKYDIFNDGEHFQRALFESVNYMANLGMLTSTWNYGSAFLQRPELGREWANRNAIEAVGGPTVGLFQDLSDLVSTVISEGDITSEKQLNTARQLFPLMNLPLISEGGKALVQEFGD